MNLSMGKASLILSVLDFQIPGLGMEMEMAKSHLSLKLRGLIDDIP
jgi:hypothetical protein